MSEKTRDYTDEEKWIIPHEGFLGRSEDYRGGNLPRSERFRPQRRRTQQERDEFYEICVAMGLEVSKMTLQFVTPEKLTPAHKDELNSILNRD